MEAAKELSATAAAPYAAEPCFDGAERTSCVRAPFPLSSAVADDRCT